jgi:hypothetical protein
VNKKFMSHITRAQHTPSAAETVQVSHALLSSLLMLTAHEIRDQITHALQAITADMLHRVWDEFDYRVDVCRVTQGAHIEGL